MRNENVLLAPWGNLRMGARAFPPTYNFWKICTKDNSPLQDLEDQAREKRIRSQKEKKESFLHCHARVTEQKRKRTLEREERYKAVVGPVVT